MEITRQLTPGLHVPAEAVANDKSGKTLEPLKSTVPQFPAPEPRLEQLQEAIRALPDIDMEQVMAIKQAIARGELSADVKVLAHTLLSYHRGHDL
jgi:negative regulator of flagellin synthesis FlgM